MLDPGHLGKLLALHVNIRISQKGLPGPNTPAYCCNFVVDETEMLSATFSAKSNICIHLGKLLALPTNLRPGFKGLP
jgi:hypothetical protein